MEIKEIGVSSRRKYMCNADIMPGYTRSTADIPELYEMDIVSGTGKFKYGEFGGDKDSQ